MRWALALDEHGAPTAGPNYCATACGGVRCGECPCPTVLPENDAAVRLIGICLGRWVTNERGHIIGFDYAQARAARRELKLPPRAFAGLLIAENEVVRLLALRRANGKQN